MKKTLSRCFSLLLCVAVLCIQFGTQVWAKIPSPSRYFYVYDEANVLTLTTEDHIVTVNDTLSAKCGAQVVIACVHTTGTTDIADYTYKMFNKWEIGDKDKKNGILVVMAVDDGDYFALQGRGLENLLSSGTLKLLLDEHLEPHFSVGDYDAGARAIFDELVLFLSQIYSVSVDGIETTAQEDTTVFQESWLLQTTEAEDDWAVDLVENGIDAINSIGSVGSSIGNAISGAFTHVPFFEIATGFIKSLSFSKIILIIVVILLLRALFGKRRHGGGGSSRG